MLNEFNLHNLEALLCILSSKEILILDDLDEQEIGKITDEVLGGTSKELTNDKYRLHSSKL